MPSKRLTPPSDSSSDISEVPLKRTQRTHEENQERAYIAASRRADRDIEHRIRSALKASECRKKRTGRGLKITREAVLGDEQYESDDDDDDAARRFRTAAATSSLSQSFPANRSDRYAEVDALFSQYFPHVQLSSRWAAPPTQRPLSHHQFHPQQPPLQIQTTFAGPYHHLPQHQPGAPDATPVSTTTTQPSPLLTPPVSYPLPPSRTEGGKSRSMSPLALEGSGSPAGSRPATATPTTTATAPTGLGLGLGLIDPSAAAGSYLLDQDPHTSQYHPHHHLPHPDQPHFFHDALAGGRTVSVPLVQAVYDDPVSTDPNGAAATVGGSGDPAWFSETSTAAPPHHNGGHGAGWHMRSLSLPSSLEAFHFPFADLPEEAGGDGGTGGEEPAAGPVTTEAELDSTSAMATAASVVDPSILAAAAAAVTGDMAAVAAAGTATPPGEPWADWIDLDGEVPTAVGVKV